MKGVRPAKCWYRKHRIISHPGTCIATYFCLAQWNAGYQAYAWDDRTSSHGSEDVGIRRGLNLREEKIHVLASLYMVLTIWDKREIIRNHWPTWRVIPSCTNSSSVSSQVPVTLSLISPLSGSTAYRGALPPRSSHICANVTQPPRVLLSADTRYNREDADEYRIDTGTLASHGGLGIGSFGDSVSCAAARLRASMLRTTAFRTVVGILAVFGVRKMLCPPRCSSTTRSCARR